MFKTPDGLEKWIKNISQHKIEDATHFEQFEYEFKEFDNIPQIITRYVLTYIYKISNVDKLNFIGSYSIYIIK